MIRPTRCAGVVLAFACSTLWAAASLDNTASWNGSDYLENFGIPNTQTYGQVITVPSGVNQLTSFTFLMQVPTTLAFRGEVYAWDGTKATGAAIYESLPTSTTNGAVFQSITFTTGGVAVTPGQQYVIFVTSSRDNSGHSGVGRLGATYTDTLSGGAFVYENNGTDPTQWTGSTWNTFAANDLVVQVAFGNAVVAAPAGAPALSTWATLVLACGVMGLAARGLVRAA